MKWGRHGDMSVRWVRPSRVAHFFTVRQSQPHSRPII